MPQLARKLRVTDYFTLGWGTMVGVGWLVIMDDWLLRGGSLGTVLGFAIGSTLLFPIGWVYGKLMCLDRDFPPPKAWSVAKGIVVLLRRFTVSATKPTARFMLCLLIARKN